MRANSMRHAASPRARHSLSPTWLCRAVALACAALLGACAAGTDYQRPAAPTAQGYAAAVLPAATASAPTPGGAAQTLVVAHEVRADWWRLFQSPALDALVERALAAHPSIEAAQAALRAAQQNVIAQRGYFYPSVQVGYSPSRTKLAGNQGGNSPGVQGDGSVISTAQNAPASQGGTAPYNAPVTYNFHTAQLTVGYVPDVFGANRRQLEALQAGVDVQQYQLQATALTLASNVVAAAIQEALLRRQIAVTEEVVDAGERSLAIVQRQLDAGYASRLDVATQQAALAQNRLLLPPLHKQLEQTRNLLRALLGQPQDVALSELPDLDALTLPEELPVTLPSALVEQRPDVRAAEAQLHAATALVGVAAANRLPQFAIDASWGGGASHLSQMFWGSGLFFNLSASVAQTLFDGGTLSARQRAAEEAVRQADAQYRATVLTAFQNVADAIRAIHADAQTLAGAVQAEQASRQAVGLARRQLAGGAIDRLTLLLAEQTYRQSLLGLAQARAARFGDAAALFQALGGGWWNPPAGPAQPPA